MAGNSPAYGGPKSFHPDHNCNDITVYLYVNSSKNILIKQYFTISFSNPFGNTQFSKGIFIPYIEFSNNSLLFS